MEQMTLELAARREGARRAMEKAEREAEGWGDLAFAFLKLYASREKGLFTGPDVTKAAKEYGLIQPANLRAWGGVYTRAQRAGVIECVDGNGRRENGSPCYRYRAAA